MAEVETQLEETPEDVYEIGRFKNDLLTIMNDDAITLFTEDDEYSDYVRLAANLNIVLEYPLQGQTIEWKKQFLNKQIKTVEKSLRRREPKNIWCLYCAGVDLEFFRTTLVKSKDNDHFKQLRQLVSKVQRAAENLDVDINEDLEQLENYYNFDEGCVDKIKNKLCIDKLTRPKDKHSEVDSSRLITNDVWAVSLVRLPDSSNAEHAFLVLEGKKKNKFKIWFADFVRKDSTRPGMREGKVRKYTFESKAVVGPSSKLLHKCRAGSLMEINEGAWLLNSTWSISNANGEKLIQNIDMQKMNPPKYSILGDSKLAGSSAAETGHNCFTFAKFMLHELKSKFIQIPEDKLEKWIASITSRYLVDKRYNGTWWKSCRLILLIIVILIVVILIGSFLYWFIPRSNVSLST
jgi:hypothetical protein